MAQQWNGKALIDFLGVRLWDSSDTFRGYILQWLNEIQSDIAGKIPLDYYLFKSKKLITDSIELVDLNPQIPTVSTVAISSGGSLIEDSVYKVYSTFIIWDESQRKYVESELSPASAEVTATDVNNTIDITAIDTHGGTVTVQPFTIWRRIYLSVKATGETSFAGPLFIQDIENNTATTLRITAESTSTISPPSYSELSQLGSKHFYFNSGTRWLVQESMNKLRRFDTDGSTSTTPNYFDFASNDTIFLYPQLSSTATDDQKTLSYFFYRRPHEVFYDVDRPIDMPFEFRKALLEGVVWKAYEFRDRAGKESVQNNYEMYKKEITDRFTRQKGVPVSIRDVNGDSFGFSV